MLCVGFRRVALQAGSDEPARRMPSSQRFTCFGVATTVAAPFIDTRDCC